MDRHIIISLNSESKGTESARQNLTVSGKVTDSTGAPLPGVTIVVKSTTNGIITDFEGKYSLTGVPGDATLVFSFVGMKPQEISVAGKSSVNVMMEEESIGIEEVVAVGYGTMKKSDLTGSAVSANIEAFRESANVSILQSLQGSVPGVQIGQTNQAGEEASISIRGVNTISGNTSPLIVVDGIIYNGRIADLNPSDIQSVDILKDASSKAIYGAQAANGVIIITTKGGKIAQKPTISYSGSVSMQTPTVKARLLNRDEVLQKIRDVNYRKAYLAPDYTQSDSEWDFSKSELLPELQNGIEKGTDFDWWDAVTSPGYIQDHLLSVSGGSELTTYYFSGGHTEQKGFVINDNYKRTSLRINIETKITNWLTVGANTFGSFTDFSGDYPTIDGLARATSPLVSPKDENGEFIVNPLGDSQVNIFLDAQSIDRDLKNRISGIFYGIIKIPKIDGLTYRINYSNNLNWFSTANSNEYSAGLTGAASKIYASRLDVMLDNILNYEKQLNDHGIKATLVSGYSNSEYDRTYASGENIPNLNLSYNSLEQAIIQEISSDAWKETAIYQMGRINYNYKNRYLATATIRRDGFSGFAKKNKFALFPSFGLGWVLSDEPFFKIPKIDYIKLRASYGQNGNQTSRYSSLARISADDGSKYVYGDGASTSLGQSVASLANNNLSWEKTAGVNSGIDFGILGNRISGNIEYYKTITTDLLWNMSLPEMTGFSKITTNLGKIANSGFEFSIKTKLVKSQNFSWDFDVNFSTNKNKIISLLGDDNNGDGKEDDLIASGLFIGKSLGAVYNYEIDGIWQLDDDILTGYYPGTYRIVDQEVNGEADGVISADNDRKILGRTEPAYRFGIQNTLKYKDFTLRFFINSIQGGKDGYLGANHPSGVANTSGTAQNSNWYTFYDYWSPSNPNGKYPIMWEQAKITPQKYYSRNFVRLQDISLAYQLNQSFAKKIGVDGAKIYLSGKNILTITQWDGWDPETGQGIQNTDAFPVMKTYTLGIEISF
ncbi:MAG: SusC/RagA family TonB-linked outer membrane protein [Bacteroidetes bacterium GWF2_42_66]|nr:MAG: SusC/RagA family TonB-linked outer membrane protein [Bacteroidetes bacterium GWA2_42_15]OFY03144.1 MAG: SusC/RagA family TonB-linked outer membrane protein [Bacteroidetes bacterium GWE2_42_39]OFY45252.1 MAG: SusC/RagA family TonB-linked outer membrane protein [Bacteroidetes bacterium GWF2_42_66]HBL74144.1 SusC/RagA family TonB-linked outer membrane protein [Prolixibacteraceae bacterium]HCR90599.1 SusC/RagA family TonB-linked outer membrane protein [Prolixibacteraceae bacterium]